MNNRKSTNLIESADRRKEDDRGRCKGRGCKFESAIQFVSNVEVLGKSKCRNRKSRLCTFKATSRGTVAHSDKKFARSAPRWPTRTNRPSPIIVGLAIQTHTHRLYACRVESPPPTGDRGHTEFQFFPKVSTPTISNPHHGEEKTAPSHASSFTCLVVQDITIAHHSPPRLEARPGRTFGDRKSQVPDHMGISWA